MTGGTITVAFCADDAYAMPLGVAALSLVTNLDPMRAIEIFVVDGGISPENRSKIHQALSGFPNLRLKWLEFSRERIAHLHGNIHLSRSAYLRIFLPEILPAGLSRVLYLDSDMVITGDVARIWDSEFQDHPILAVQDRSRTLGRGVAHWKELGLDPAMECFNSGLLLMDLENWRQSGLVGRLLEYVAKNQSLLTLCDQDALNAVLAGRWGSLDPSWNQQIVRKTRDSLPQLLLSHLPGFRKLPPRPPGILHFISDKKPWLPRCWFAERRYFSLYQRKSPWADREITILHDAWSVAREILRRIPAILGFRKRA